MMQLTSSWQMFVSLLFIISVALLKCLCAKCFFRYRRRIGTEKVIIPSQYSSETTTSSVLCECSVMRSLIPPPPTATATATSEDKNGELREEEEEVMLQESNVNSFLDLPSDVLLHITSFLPLESIGPLVGVCKSWSDVLREPRSMNLILGRPNHNRTFLLGKKYREHRTSDLHLLEDITTSEKRFEENYWGGHGPQKHGLASIRTSMFHLRRLPCGNKIQIASTCSGFICGYYRGGQLGDITFCNPLTLESVTLPELPKTKPKDYSLFGLGIDLTRNKSSKLVRLLCNSEETFVLECNVYTFGSDCWRSVEVPKLLPCSNGILYNWTLYWTMCKGPSILKFDLENERFSLVSPPNTKEGREPRRSYMVNLGDELCYVIEYDGETGIHVLEDDATMVWSLRYHVSSRRMSLFGLWANDALFVSNFMNIYYYDLRCDNVWQIFVHPYLSVVGQFFPTLMSPKIFWS